VFYSLKTQTQEQQKKPYFQKETHKEPQPPKKFNNKESHPRRFQKKGQRKERDYSSVQCYHCDKMGHIDEIMSSQARIIQEKT
jgi:hypothetical protein